jgi:uncharacterized caspase-like protein/WD40 repeat protein
MKKNAMNWVRLLLAHCALMLAQTVALEAQTPAPPPEPPLVELRGVPQRTDQKEISVELRVTAKGGGMGPVEVYLNGVLYAVEGSRGLQAKPLAGATLVRSLRLDLPQGANELRVIAYDQSKKLSASATTSIVSMFRDWDFSEEFPASYAGKSAAALLEASLRTPSVSERAMLRAYLVKAYPDSAEGLFAKAWILNSAKESPRLLEAAIAKNPRIPVAYNNLISFYEELELKDEAFRTIEKLLAAAPDYDGYNFVYIQFFRIKDRSGLQAAESFRASWVSRLGAAHPVFPEIDAALSKDSGNFASAEKAYVRAVSTGRAPLRNHTSLLDLRLDRLLASAPEQTRLAALGEYVQAVAGMSDPKSKYDGLMIAARRIFDDFKDRLQAVKLALAAYQAYPGAEALQLALDRGGSYWHADLAKILEGAESALARNPVYALTMATSCDLHRDDPAGAEAWLVDAVRWAHTQADRNRAIGRLGTLYESRMAQPDKAKKLFMASESFRNDKASLYWNLHRNRMEAMDFDEAKAYLELYAPFIDTSGSWYRNRSNLVSALAASREAPPASSIAISSVLHSLHMAVSPKDNTVAVGDWPMSIWDVDRGIKIRDLGRGGFERCFSPDGKLVATIAEHDDAFVLYIYEAATSRVALAWPNTLKLESPCFSPDGKRLALCDGAGLVHVFDTAEGKKTASFQMGILEISGPMFWTSKNLIVCGQAQSDVVTIRDGTDYRLLKSLPGVSWPHALGATFDGRYVLCSDNRRILTVWDTKNWQARSMQARTGSKKIIPHPTKNLVLMDNFTGSVDGRSVGLSLFDVEAMRFTAECAGSNHMDAGFSHGGTRILTESALSIEVLDSGLVPQKEWESPFYPMSLTLLDRKNGYLVYHVDERTLFVDVTTGERVRSEKEAWPYLWKEAGGTLLRALDTAAGMEAWLLDTSTFASRKILTTAERFSIHSVGERYLVLSSVDRSDRDERGKCDNPNGKGEIEIWDKDTFSRVAAFSFPLCTESTRLGLYSPGIEDIAVDETSGIVAVATSWDDGWGTSGVTSRNVQRYDFKGEALPPLRLTEEAQGLQYLPDGTLRVRFKDRSAVYRGLERVSKYSSTSMRELSLRGDQRLLWNNSHVELRDRRLVFPGNLDDILVDQDRNLLIAVLSYNEISFFDLETFQHRCSLVVKDAAAWLAYTPSGEYASSERGADFAYWNDRGTLIPFGRVSALKNDPRVLSRSFAAIRERSREKVISSLELPFPAGALDRLVAIDTKMPADAKVSTASANLSFSIVRQAYDAAGRNYIVPTLELYQNGRKVPARYLPQPAFTDQETLVSASIPLSAGQNSFELRAIYRGIELGRKKVSVFRDRAEGSPGSIYFLGIGVGAYARSAQDLRYARADVEGLRDALAALRGRPYAQVHSLLLLDEKAKGTTIGAAFRDFLSQAKEEDLVVVYLSGHGAKNDRQELCLLTHESDFAEPGTWYELKELRSYLVNRPLLQRAIVVMDICHAGSGIPAGTLGQRREATSEQSAWDMTRETGTLYLAAALGSQKAFEGESFGGGHGAFTAALLEGLSGKAGGKDGIGSHELAKYVIDRVVTLTEGSQIPVSNYAATLDFKISRPGDAPAGATTTTPAKKIVPKLILLDSLAKAKEAAAQERAKSRKVEIVVFASEVTSGYDSAFSSYFNDDASARILAAEAVCVYVSRKEDLEILRRDFGIASFPAVVAFNSQMSKIKEFYQPDSDDSRARLIKIVKTTWE